MKENGYLEVPRFVTIGVGFDGLNLGVPPFTHNMVIRFVM